MKHVFVCDAAREAHLYNGMGITDFARLAGLTPQEVSRMVGRGYFRQSGRQPEIFNLNSTTGRRDSSPKWSFLPSALERYQGEAPAREVKRSRKASIERWTRGVYVIRTEEGPRRYKIGFASDLNRRFSGLRTMSPVEVRIVAFVAGGTTRLERGLHRVFREQRLHGEWFSESPALLRFIAKHTWEG